MSLKRRGPQLKLPLHAGPWTSRTQAAERRKEGLWDITELTMNFAFNPRDGIDNPALSLAEDSEPEGASQLRFCFLKKEEGESFGFWLRQEVGKSGHIVRQVTPGGAGPPQGPAGWRPDPRGERHVCGRHGAFPGKAWWRVRWRMAAPPACRLPICRKPSLP
ncbi:Na(+)/H(+) exchange regulatory cofactor NHE-RF4 [Varanus komodoensis]|nr:Na(+)/H(+) exchange regulatory cofactor NHE-RF4 [Varanus komodoensis]